MDEEVKQVEQQEETKVEQPNEEVKEQPKEEPKKESNKGKELKKHYVDSSNIQWIAYDEELNNLYVAFNNNSVYVYYEVPKEIFENFMRAGSKGRYLHMYIKRNNRYKYKKLS